MVPGSGHPNVGRLPGYFVSGRAFTFRCSIDHCKCRYYRPKDFYSVLYRKKLHTVYPMLYKPTLENSKN